MEINNIGIGYCHPKDFQILRPSGSGDFLLLFIKSRAFFTLNGTDTPVLPNTVFIFKKGTPQLYRAADEEFRNDWLHFEASAEELGYIEELNIPYDTPLQCSDPARISVLMQSLSLEKLSASPRRSEVIDLYFKLLLLKVSECMQPSSTESPLPHYDKLSQLRTDIYNSPHTEYTVKAIADRLSFSESYLQHLYKRVFGVSISADIITARIDRAKYLLSGTTYTVSVIAKMCGYNSDVHFMRQFKEIAGMTPTEYRCRFKPSQ